MNIFQFQNSNASIVTEIRLAHGQIADFMPESRFNMKNQTVYIMNKKIYEMHAQICKVFTSAKRLEIINLLRDGEKTVNDLAEQAGVLQANISQHLTVLRQNNVVTTRRDGANVYYKIANPKILQACDLMREVLLEKLAENEKLAKRMS